MNTSGDVAVVDGIYIMGGRTGNKDCRVRELTSSALGISSEDDGCEFIMRGVQSSVREVYPRLRSSNTNALQDVKQWVDKIGALDTYLAS